MARRAAHLDDTAIVIVNPDDDVSVNALTRWIEALEDDDDWIDLPTTAADALNEDRPARGA